MAQEVPQFNFNVDIQRLADAITNRNDLFQLIPNRYDGDPKKFREWIKQIEKYCFMTDTHRDKVKLIAYKTSTGPVSDFIERYITINANNTWEQLKAELTLRFAEISDPQQALKMLREIKQKREENVQCFAERLLSLATEAFADQPGGMQAAERQLIGHFNDGLYYDFLQYKLLRSRPQTLQEAVRICIDEQNIIKLFKHKTGRDYGRQTNDTNDPEYMEVDQFRPTRRCQICYKNGHTAQYCRKRQNPTNVRAVAAENRKCYFCGKVGHIKRFCTEFKKQNSPPLNDRTPRM